MNKNTNNDSLSTSLSVLGIIDGTLLDKHEIEMLSLKFDKRRNNIRFELNYPLSVKYSGFIESAENWWDILSAIAIAYKQIYKKPKHYGIWGHDIGDLYVETLELEGNNLEIFIGS